jgi:aminopeptidase N
MQEMDESRVHPKLKDLVVEASRSLALLDADRLEELALSCRTLNRRLAPLDAEARAELKLEAAEAAGDMAVFGRVLEATRANLEVMRRLRRLRAGCLEYSERQVRGRGSAEGSHGDN